MTNSQRLATVRAHLQQWLREQYPGSGQESGFAAADEIGLRQYREPAVEEQQGDSVDIAAMPSQESNPESAALIGPVAGQVAENAIDSSEIPPDPASEEGADLELESRGDLAEAASESGQDPSEAGRLSVIGAAAAEGKLSEEIVQEAEKEIAERSDQDQEIAESLPLSPPAGPRIVNESILIRDGFYAGRTFHAVVDDLRFKATWFMEPDELKIRDSSGDVLAVFRGAEITGQSTPEVSDEGTVSLPLSEVDERREDGGDGSALPKAA